MKKFLSNLYSCIKIPVMMFILSVQNTWRIFVVGFICIAVLVIGGLLNSGIPLFAFLTIMTFFPVYFSKRNLKNCLHTLKNGLKADGILTDYRNDRDDFSEITFADNNCNLYSKKFRLFYISEPDYNKRFTVIYDPENPEDFYISVKSMAGYISELIFAVIIFALALYGLVIMIV